MLASTASSAWRRTTRASASARRSGGEEAARRSGGGGGGFTNLAHRVAHFATIFPSAARHELARRRHPRRDLALRVEHGVDAVAGRRVLGVLGRAALARHAVAGVPTEFCSGWRGRAPGTGSLSSGRRFRRLQRRSSREGPSVSCARPRARVLAVDRVLCGRLAARPGCSPRARAARSEPSAASASRPATAPGRAPAPAAAASEASVRRE